MADDRDISLITTLEGSRLEEFFPEAWDLAQWEDCVVDDPAAIFQRQAEWHDDFTLRQAETVSDFNVMMGHELARVIQQYRIENRELALILPVGPMGMYKWTMFFLEEWDIACDHVSTFLMDEWSNEDGDTIPPSESGSFQNAIEDALFEPLGPRTVPPAQRHYATKEELPTYGEEIENIRSGGGDLVVVYGIGRACHIAFWEPHFGAEFGSDEEWREQEYRIGAELHPLTIEQNAITSFKSRTTRVPAYANTIGPGLFTRADYAIGGADGELGRGMQWQGLSLWVTLRHPRTRHIPSTWMPSQPGVLFFTQELAGPLKPETN